MEIWESLEFGILCENDPLCVRYVVTVLWLWYVAAEADREGATQSQKMEILYSSSGVRARNLLW